MGGKPAGRWIGSRRDSTREFVLATPINALTLMLRRSRRKSRTSGPNRNLCWCMSSGVASTRVNSPGVVRLLIVNGVSPRCP